MTRHPDVFNLENAKRKRQRGSGPRRVGETLPGVLRAMGHPAMDAVATALEEGRDPSVALAVYMADRDTPDSAA